MGDVLLVLALVLVDLVLAFACLMTLWFVVYALTGWPERSPTYVAWISRRVHWWRR